MNICGNVELWCSTPPKTSHQSSLCSKIWCSSRLLKNETKYLSTWIWHCKKWTPSFAKWVECLPMVRETGVQSQVESYQRLKKWYLMPPCLTLSIIRYASRVKWGNPGNGVVPSLHHGVVAIEKGAFESPSTMVANFTLLYYTESTRYLLWLTVKGYISLCCDYKVFIWADGWRPDFVGFTDNLIAFRIQRAHLLTID